MNVLVTGGTGFIGKRLKLYRPRWNYISSSDCDLTNTRECNRMIGLLKPDAIVHLAGRVGGIKDNTKNQASFYYQNTMINTNVIHSAYLNGVKRVLASLTTCSFPDKLKEYPFKEEDIFNGPPTDTNFSYGYAKRALHVQCRAYRKQYGLNYSTFCPSNVYGPGDTFGSEKSHFVSSLISKVAALKDGESLELWGSGMPLRQQLYVDDLCEIIPMLLKKHNNNVPVIVAPDQNLSINKMANILITRLNKDIEIVYNKQLDGQFRKDGSNMRLKKIIGDYKFTSFEEGVVKTYEWYIEKAGKI
jgi:GDP-L-fucose synthase